MSFSTRPARVRATPVIPPGQHDPRPRLVADQSGAWQFRLGGDCVLQLWAPSFSVSLLRISGDEPRACRLLGGWDTLVASESMVRALLDADLGIAIPSRARILAAERWHLRIESGDPNWELAVHRPDA